MGRRGLPPPALAGPVLVLAPGVPAVTDLDRLEWKLAMAAGGIMLLAGSIEHAVLAFLIGYVIVRRDRP